jgi:hypothetical protein
MSEPEHDRQFRLYSQCRSCSAEVIWAKSERGNWIPLNAAAVHPAGQGHFVLRGDVAVAVPSLVFEDEPHYVSHFSTCPNAEQHRRRRTA